MSEMEKHVESLIKKAAEEHDSGDAMRRSQAALNAVAVLKERVKE